MTAAKLWKDTDSPIDEKTFCFALIHRKIENISEAFGEVHAPYRIEFLNNSQRAFSKCGHKQITFETVEGGYGEIQEQNPVSFTRSKLPLARNIICFICYTKRNVNNNQHKKGGIARCS